MMTERDKRWRLLEDIRRANRIAALYMKMPAGRSCGKVSAVDGTDRSGDQGSRVIG